MTVNLELLKNPNDIDNFIEELANAQTKILKESASDFYDIVFSYFEDPVDEDLAETVLVALTNVLSFKENVDAFIKGDYAGRLPFSLKGLTDSLLDLLYVIVTRAPEAFDQDVADGFSRMIVRRPRKALSIIAIYSQYFEFLENPWPLLDDLIDGERRFSVPECAIEYINLLAYLVAKFRGFRRGRAKACFDCIVQNLESEDPDVINTAYGALATIVSNEQNILIPFKEIRAHLRHEELQDSVLDFLLVAPLNIDEVHDPVFLQRLLKISESSEKATYVLMRLAEDVRIAQLLVADPNWMVSDLPSSMDTLKLFLVCFKHLPMRPIITNLPQFIEFLRMINAVADESILSLICTIVRRIELNRKLILELSSSKFIAEFLANAEAIQTDSSNYSAILFVDTLTKVAYTKEMTPMCTTVSVIIQDGGENLSAAIKLATDLCKHPRCQKAFQDNRLDTYLERRINKMKNRGHIRNLIKLIRNE